MLAWGAALASGLAVFLLFERFHSGPPMSVVFWSDMLNYYYPMTERVSSRLAAGEWPLWNPSVCGGMPLLATLQAGALYPGIWLSVWLGPQHGMYWLLAIECGIGSVLAAWACRLGGRSAAASAFGGLIFGFGCLIGTTWWSSTTATLCWMPGLIVGIEKLSRKATVSGWSCLVGFTALQCLGGFPQYQVYSFLFAGPYAAVRLGAEWHRDGFRAGLRPTLQRGASMLAAIVVGVGIAGAQLLPSMELAAESSRAGNLSADAVSYLYSTPNLAQFFENASDPRPKLIIFDYDSQGGYIGIATLALAALGLVARWRRPETWYVAIAGAVFLFLSNGYREPSRGLYELFATLPLVGAFRTPDRLRFLWFFCVLLLASDGFAAFADGYRRLRAQRFTAVIALGAAAAVLVAVLLRNADGAWVRTIGCALLLVAVWPLAHRRVARGTLQGLMLAMIFADLYLAIAPTGMLPLQDALIRGTYSGVGPEYGTPKLEDLIHEAGNSRVEFVGFSPRIGVGDASRVHTLSCWEPLMPAAWQGLIHTLKPDAKLGGSGRLGSGFTTLYDVGSVRSSLTKKRGRGRTVVARSNPDALPRAYVVERYEIASQQTAFERIRDGDFDFRHAVMLEQPVERVVRVDKAGSRPPLEPRKATAAEIEHYQDESVEIRAETQEHALLVLTDGFYPGWVARVDGKPTEILRANGVFRAVQLPPGNRTIVFSYEPQSFAWGLWVSGVSLAIWLGVGLGGIARGRRRTRRVAA